MLHTTRRWNVITLGPLQLAHRLANNSWTLCTGFRCEGLLWLNDSTSEDAVQEYAVVRESDGKQIESITIWDRGPREVEKVLEQQEYLSVDPDSFPCLSGWELGDRLEHPDGCRLCA